MGLECRRDHFDREACIIDAAFGLAVGFDRSDQIEDGGHISGLEPLALDWLRLADPCRGKGLPLRRCGPATRTDP